MASAAFTWHNDTAPERVYEDVRDEAFVTASAASRTFDRVPLYPKQAAIVDDEARFTITEATTKAGKTMSHIEWLLGEAAKLRRGHLWWVATVSGTADIAFRRTQDRLLGYLDSSGEMIQVGERIPFTRNKTEKWIEVFGARIWFKSADKPDTLYGEDVYRLVGDEVTRWKEEAWNACYSTLTATRGTAKLIGNVKGKRNWAFRKARQAETNSLPGWSHHRLTAYDAVEGGVIDRDTVDAAARDLPDHVFRELYLAEPADDGGNPFGLDAIEACVLDFEPDTKPTVFGVDLAKSQDWTWIIGLDSEGRQCYSERFQLDWGATRDRILAAVGRTPTWIDSTGVGDPIVEDLQKHAPNVVGFKFSSPSKQQLMEGLAAGIQQRRIRYYDEQLVMELESFEYEYTRTGVRYNAPQGLHDDGVCALALAWRGANNYRPAVSSGGFYERESY